MKIVLIEHDGALYRGGGRAWPQEVYDFNAGAWSPYQGSVPKPQEWGSEIDEAQAQRMIAEHKAQR